MLKKNLENLLCIIFLLTMFIVFVFFNIGKNEEYIVSEVISPIEFILNNGKNYKLENYQTFDSYYSESNKVFAKQLNITEDEAFILGNLGKYFTRNIMNNRIIKIKDNNLTYFKFNYLIKFQNSPFCLKYNQPTNNFSFQRQLSTIRKGNFIILDLENDTYYPICKSNSEKIKNFVIVRKTHVKNSKPSNNSVKNKELTATQIADYNSSFQNGDIKIIVTDMTSKLFPDRNCSSDICKELVANIDQAKESIDMAIYGYSETPAIEKSLKNAIKRGVRIRLVYDLNSKGENIYSDTPKLIKLIPTNMSDKNSKESNYTMHNKFYIFDNKTVISGSANLSFTDMSGYNTNSIIVIKFPQIANIYTQEFEQMFSGKFHNTKSVIQNKNFNDIQIFFSPQDKTIQNGIIPIVKNAKKYIYVPAFIITENKLSEELINAKKRGVDVKIITDAVNASSKNSKVKIMREAGVPIKAENYAGKIHSKTMIIDDNYLIIGSMNFSYSGENRNDENTIILTNSEYTKFYKNFFLYQWNKIPDKWLKYTPRAEGKDSIGSCIDGIDNNYDGYIDSEDKACKI